MSEAGAAMNAAGDATTFIRRSLQRMGRAYGLDRVEVFVVPTLLLLKYGDGRATFVDLSSQIPADLRLDQIAALYDLVEEAEAGRINPADGLRRLRSLVAMSPRHSALVRTLGSGFIAAGVVFTLGPAPAELLLAVLLSMAVGAIREIVRNWPQVWPLLPAAAGVLVGGASFTLVDEGLEASPLKILVPALVTFLPGAALTVSMIELSNGDIVAGGSRLAYGTMRLFLLVFGVLIAAQWFGVPQETAAPDAIPLGRLLPLLGVALFTAGVYWQFSAPVGSFPWLLLVVAAAWAGQQLGALFLGGSLDGFAGGTVMIVVARMIQGKAGAPPLIVSFTPAFWFLVPGALGLEGLSNLVSDRPQAGINDILSMVTTMISIALGVLFGLLLSGSSRSREPV
ncbi:MAG: threonine/serine exporter ThrE family protein [Dehalococcoidia bacterium]